MIAVLPPLAVHWENPSSADRWSGVFLYLSSEKVQDTLGAAAPSAPRIVDAPAGGRLLAAIPALLDAGNSSEPVVSEVIRQAFEPAAAEELQAVATQVPAVRRARRYVDGLPRAAQLCLTDLAEVAGLSRYHLSRIFRKAVGVSPYAYFEQIRVARAREMLHDGLPVAVAAFGVGYADQSHFTRHFKRRFAVTPGQYARAVRRARKRA
jgi:AraC-like DNA-binding protein